MYIKTRLIIFFSLLIPFTYGQNTVGLINYDAGNSDGYVLFSPMTATDTYLIDKCGEKVHEWNASTYRPALSSFLLTDGSLLRTGQLNNAYFNEGGSGGVIEQFDWNGNQLWNFSISDSVNCLHHDIKPLPNGNVLCIVWDSYSKQEAVANGKDITYNQTKLWSEKIVELKPIGADSAELVWEWKLFDHLVQDYDNTKPNYGVVSEHPELMDINYFPGIQNTADWIHLNSIDYNAELDQILVSAHRTCEGWIIDHSTTTAEAASHLGGNSGKGGDLLYRWGNPQAYQRGNPSTKVFYGQHHASWIPPNYPNAGKIIVFNNGLGRPGDYSSIDMIAPPLDGANIYTTPATEAFLPAGLDWSYVANTPSDFYSSNISGVHPIEDGSFFITSGANGVFFEISATNEKRWEYVNPVNSSGVSTQGDVPTGNPVFRSNFYPTNYLGLQGQLLTPLGEIELNPTQPSICETLGIEESIDAQDQIYVYPNPFSNEIKVEYGFENKVDFVLFNAFGQEVLRSSFTNETTINTAHLSPGVYYYEFSDTRGSLKKGKLLK
jgi:hypothetical protein